VTNSTFSGNGALEGGAIATESGKVTNSTFSGNSARTSPICASAICPPFNGGAILNGGEPLTVTNCTFSGNNASNGSAIASVGFNTVTVVNSILANGTGTPGGNCFVDDHGSIADGGHNIDDGTTCSFTGANCATTTGTPFCNTNPLLDPAGLASNGGPTQTIALEAGSPAINAGDETVCAAPPVNNLDQRGFVRPGAGGDLLLNRRL
jgi:hypothetical protein